MCLKKRKKKKRKIVSMMYARIMHKKKKKKEKRKKERSLRTHPNQQKLYMWQSKFYMHMIWKKKLCRRAAYHMGTYEFKFFRHIRKLEFINVQSQIILLTEACIKYLD